MDVPEKLRQKPRLTIHKRLLLWLTSVLILTALLGGAGLLAIQEILSDHQRASDLWAGVDEVGDGLNQGIARLLARQMVIQRSDSLAEMKIIERRVSLEVPLHEALQKLRTMEQAPEMTGLIRELELALDGFLKNDSALFASVFAVRQMDDDMALLIQALDRAIAETAQSSEAIRGKVRLMISHAQRQLRQFLREQPQGKEQVLRRQVASLMFGKDANIRRNSVVISSGVAALATLSREVLLESDPDALAGFKANMATHYEQTTRDAILNLVVLTAGSPELKAHVGMVNTRFKKVMNLLTGEGDGLITLRRRQLRMEVKNKTLLRAGSVASARLHDGLKQLNLQIQNFQDRQQASTRKTAFAARTMVFGVGGLVVLVLGVVGMTMTRRIVHPLRQLTGALVDIERQGNFSKRIEFSSNDELGDAIQALNALLGTLQSAQTQIITTMSAAANGDFSQKITMDLKGDLAVIKESLNQQIQTLGTTSDSRKIINRLLETALEPMSLERQLEAILGIIFSIPWFALLPKGAIFLADPESGELVLRAHRGFDDHLLASCSRLKPDQCLCGKAFAAEKTIFAPHIDHDHDILPPNAKPHGHYVVPIMARGHCYGVINLYVPDGHAYSSEEEAFLIALGHTIVGLVERRKIEKRLKVQAEIDTLTGLPNRALFQQTLGSRIAYAKRTHQEVVLMFLDLDRFKVVNDTMGHEAGDELLREAADRIGHCVREYDTVSRLGGDEFTVILPQITHLCYAEFVARRIIEELERPFQLKQGEVTVSTSIGITIYPNDADHADELLKHADSAMYHAKDSGRGTFHFYTAAMQEKALARVHLEKALREAVQQEQFTLFYQPKLDLEDHSYRGMEALIRWFKSDGSMVSPADFIPLAEETGLIVPIGEWVLKSACMENRRLIKQGFGPLRVAVNLSARQFLRPEALIASVQAALTAAELSPEHLELEITESMVMEDPGRAIETMNRINEMGIQISIDDFGTGHSSFGSLRTFPISTLKIDQSFIRDLQEGNDAAAIAAGIISMAKELKLKVVAEGVEEAEQLAFLKRQGCDIAQGYHMSRPLPADEFEAFLGEQTSG
ncbi:MAG: EAL domain-containing protein [Magnetococcales bacterium]|nr:EAL domain-containing protein [Magnetococcales bacterium]